MLFLISAIVCLPSGLLADEIENHDGESWKEELRSTKKETLSRGCLKVVRHRYCTFRCAALKTVVLFKIKVENHLFDFETFL